MKIINVTADDGMICDTHVLHYAQRDYKKIIPDRICTNSYKRCLIKTMLLYLQPSQKNNLLLFVNYIMNQLNLRPEDKWVINATVIYNNIQIDKKTRKLLLYLTLFILWLFLLYLSAYSYHQWDNNWYRPLTWWLSAILWIILSFYGLWRILESI